MVGDNFGDHDAESCVMLLALEHLVSAPHEGDTNVSPCHFGENKTLNGKKSRNSRTVILFLVPTRYEGLAQIYMASLFWSALRSNVSAEMGITRTSEVPNGLKIN